MIRDVNDDTFYHLDSLDPCHNKRKGSSNLSLSLFFLNEKKKKICKKNPSESLSNKKKWQNIFVKLGQNKKPKR